MPVHHTYLCIATDGVRFLTYSPMLIRTTKKDVTSDDVQLHLLEEADWAKRKPHWLKSGGAGKINSIGKLRGMVRDMLKDELKEIDTLVHKILGE